MILTTKQQEVLDEIFSFILNSAESEEFDQESEFELLDESEKIKYLKKFTAKKSIPDKSNIFYLSGPAGSGKSELTREITKLCKASGVYPCIMAPTNQACGVLRQKFGKVGVICMTVAKALGVSMTVDDKGNEIFEYSKLSLPKKTGVLIIDEASMIDEKEVRLLYSFKGPILFVGDHRQIGPVNGTMNYVYKNVKNAAYLDKVMRTENPDLVSFINNFIRMVDNGRFDEKCFISDYSVYNKGEFKKQIIQSFNSDAETKVLAWRNKTVDEYNYFIRSSLFGQNPDKYNQGEKIIFNKYVSYDTEHNFYVSELHCIDEVEVVKKGVLNPSCICDTPAECIEYICEIDETQEEGCVRCDKCYTQKSYQKYVECEFYRLVINECEFYKPLDEYRTSFNKILYKHKIRANNNKSSELHKSIITTKNMYDVPIVYSYAMTVHKAQGSGFENVFVDVHDIYQSSEKLNLVYTAISRTRKNLRIFYC